MNSATRVAVALGSNLGDRHSHLDFAVERLRRLLDGPVFSARHETQPEGGPASQPMYLNAVAVGGCALPPLGLLDELQAVEALRGRERPFANAPRTLDLDIVLFGPEVIRHERLIVPHPRFRERRFVLEPLCEVAPDMVDPITGLTALDLLRRLNDAG